MSASSSSSSSDYERPTSYTGIWAKATCGYCSRALSGRVVSHTRQGRTHLMDEACQTAWLSVQNESYT